VFWPSLFMFTLPVELYLNVLELPYPYCANVIALEFA